MSRSNVSHQNPQEENWERIRLQNAHLRATAPGSVKQTESDRRQEDSQLHGNKSPHSTWFKYSTFQHVTKGSSSQASWSYMTKLMLSKTQTKLQPDTILASVCRYDIKLNSTVSPSLSASKLGLSSDILQAADVCILHALLCPPLPSAIGWHMLKRDILRCAEGKPRWNIIKSSVA